MGRRKLLRIEAYYSDVDFFSGEIPVYGFLEEFIVPQNRSHVGLRAFKLLTGDEHYVFEEKTTQVRDIAHEIDGLNRLIAFMEKQREAIRNCSTKDYEI